MLKDRVKLNEWYRKDAAVAVNQAAGRLIRHTNDFGCLFLVGDTMPSGKRLPIWVQQSDIKEGESLEDTVKATMQFVDDKRRKGELQ